jgi:hypothetical protein
VLVVNALLQAFNNKTAIEFIASLVEPLQEEPCSSSQVKAPPKRKAAANRQPQKKQRTLRSATKNL